MLQRQPLRLDTMFLTSRVHEFVCLYTTALKSCVPDGLTYCVTRLVTETQANIHLVLPT